MIFEAGEGQGKQRFLVSSLIVAFASPGLCFPIRRAQKLQQEQNARGESYLEGPLEIHLVNEDPKILGFLLQIFHYGHDEVFTENLTVKEVTALIRMAKKYFCVSKIGIFVDSFIGKLADAQAKKDGLSLQLWKVSTAWLFNDFEGFSQATALLANHDRKISSNWLTIDGDIPIPEFVLSDCISRRKNDMIKLIERLIGTTRERPVGCSKCLPVFHELHKFLEIATNGAKRPDGSVEHFTPFHCDEFAEFLRAQEASQTYHSYRCGNCINWLSWGFLDTNGTQFENRKYGWCLACARAPIILDYHRSECPTEYRNCKATSQAEHDAQWEIFEIETRLRSECLKDYKDTGMKYVFDKRKLIQPYWIEREIEREKETLKGKEAMKGKEALLDDKLDDTEKKEDTLDAKLNVVVEEKSAEKKEGRPSILKKMLMALSGPFTSEDKKEKKSA